MKKTLTIIVLFFTLSTVNFAQSSSSESQNMGKKNDESSIGKSVESVFNYVFSERIITNSIVIGEVLILLMVLYYWKRTHSDTKKDVGDVYRKNINAIRNERIRPIFVENSNLRRRQILKEMKKRPLTGKSITSSAKKLYVAKGELLLAARIQQLQNRSK